MWRWTIKKSASARNTRFPGRCRRSGGGSGKAGSGSLVLFGHTACKGLGVGRERTHLPPYVTFAACSCHFRSPSRYHTPPPSTPLHHHTLPPPHLTCTIFRTMPVRYKKNNGAGEPYALDAIVFFARHAEQVCGKVYVVDVGGGTDGLVGSGGLYRLPFVSPASWISSFRYCSPYYPTTTYNAGEICLRGVPP